MGEQWTRKSAAALAETAMKAGLTPAAADTAVEVGARLLAHGFTYGDIDTMIIDHYRRAAEREHPNRRE